MKTIAIIRIGRLGDVTLTGPTIKNLRFLYPNAKIVLITRTAYKSIASILPGLDEIVPFPDNGGYFDLVKLSSCLDDLEPELVVDLHKNFRSFHIANMSKAPYKVVYHKRRKERRAAVNEKKFVSPIPHTIDLYNNVINMLKGEIIARRPDLSLPGDALFGHDIQRSGIALVPGASSAVKAWSVEKYAEVAERIIYDFKIPVSIFLAESERKLASHFDHLPNEAITIHNNLSLEEIALLLSRTRLTLTNDSGLMHLSSATGTPTLALFGPTHEQLGFYPRGLHDQMINTDEKCRPCSLHGNEPCYREEQYCFTKLSVDGVYDKVCAALERIKLEPAIFIDRDGCLIEDKHYLADPQKVEFIPGSLDAVRNLKEAGYRIIVVSNQSGVARGFFPVETVEKVNRHIGKIMQKAECEPDEFRFCPYYPDGDDPEYTGDSYDRKPKPGMLEKAAIKYGIDIKRSFMIGDKYSDMLCGKAAGTATILVRTGEGKEAAEKIPSHHWLQPDLITENLKSAAESILKPLPKDGSRRPIF